MDENMLKMQQEAVERVRIMQERARKYVEGDLAHHGGGGKTDCEKPKVLPVAPHKDNMSLLGLLGEDKDQLLLLMLAVLLVKSNAPIELILAILYIAM
ncbi:MAG: hypothetical protein PHR24_02020 [Oscillospiraceae bacterium]|nr:hypothetical protein [Oscillospiraceae bacterium]MDD3832859.1 hypothetical protein [Oscillospiraceae bacterium]MDD4546057.1 hypothetical protein [Oscillospiraceae bacterium]